MREQVLIEFYVDKELKEEAEEIFLFKNIIKTNINTSKIRCQYCCQTQKLHVAVNIAVNHKKQGFLKLIKVSKTLISCG